MLRIGRNISRVARLMALLVTPLFVFESTASAQVTVGPAGAQLRSHHTFQPIRDSLNTIDYGRIAGQRVPGASVQTAASGRKRSVMRSVLAERSGRPAASSRERISAHSLKEIAATAMIPA